MEAAKPLNADAKAAVCFGLYTAEFLYIIGFSEICCLNPVTG
jgi:hypothetical protein